MKIFCMSDIHGCYKEFSTALSKIQKSLDNEDSKLILLGDYIHGGNENYEVCKKIMELQKEYGTDRVITLMGNHERDCIENSTPIETSDKYNKEIEEILLKWFKTLKLYHVEENNIFVHAGIDEEAGDLWKVGTPKHYFTDKYPASIGQTPNLDMNIIAGHIGTSTISGNLNFHGVWHDGHNHYYIDGNTTISHIIPILTIDTYKNNITW